MAGSRDFLRQNAFLLAATALPVAVVVFFVLASVIPRWTVPPPAYDLLLRTEGGYDQSGPRVSVDYNVRDGRVEATVRPLPPNVNLAPAKLFLFEHATMNVREIAVDLPDLSEGDPPRTFVVDGFEGRRAEAQTRAPDGYALDIRARRGPGLVGEIFGMGRYDSAASLVNRGHVVPIRLPADQRFFYGLRMVGWLVPSQ
ncbi:MAG TPA: hypothetical protein VM818_07325 [Vicinamibacterales bacterium]|jgi:hypothetical protein|nr:hypothetical protein [Vicinamibacterales bacterium]